MAKQLDPTDAEWNASVSRMPKSAVPASSTDTEWNNAVGKVKGYPQLPNATIPAPTDAAWNNAVGNTAGGYPQLPKSVLSAVPTAPVAAAAPDYSDAVSRAAGRAPSAASTMPATAPTNTEWDANVLAMRNANTEGRLTSYPLLPDPSNTMSGDASKLVGRGDTGGTAGFVVNPRTGAAFGNPNQARVGTPVSSVNWFPRQGITGVSAADIIKNPDLLPPAPASAAAAAAGKAQPTLHDIIAGPIGREMDREGTSPKAPAGTAGTAAGGGALPAGVTDVGGGIIRRGNTFTNLGVEGLNDIDAQKRGYIPTGGPNASMGGSYGGGALAAARAAAADRGDFEAISNSYGGNFAGGRFAGAQQPQVANPISGQMDIVREQLNKVSNDDSMTGRMRERELSERLLNLGKLEHDYQQTGAHQGIQQQQIGVNQRAVGVQEAGIPIHRAQVGVQQTQADTEYMKQLPLAQQETIIADLMRQNRREEAMQWQRARKGEAGLIFKPGDVYQPPTALGQPIRTAPVAGLGYTPMMVGAPPPPKKQEQR